MDFWGGLDRLLKDQEVVVERPKGIRLPCESLRPMNRIAGCLTSSSPL